MSWFGTLIRILFTIGGVLFLYACSKEEIPENSARVEVYVRIVSSAFTKGAGDPGNPNGEELMWDHLQILFGGTEGIISRELTKAEFDALPDAAGYRGAKIIPMVVPAGRYHVYGVAYQKQTHAALHAQLRDPALQLSQLNTITLSNQFAENAYYMTLAANVTEQPVQVGDPNASVYLPVTRLAAKIDLQWDAADAYAQYADVGVGRFACSIPAAGYLFPSLNASKPAIGQPLSIDFMNNTPISRRNGRLYHYLFTDPAMIPSFNFHIEAKQIGTNGSLTPVTKEYIFQFQASLLSGSWYKVNVAIRGLSGSQTTFVINNSGQSIIP